MSIANWQAAVKLGREGMEEFHIQQAAYFFSLERSREGRWRPTEDDWQNGNWRMNSKRFWALERAVVNTVQTACGEYRWGGSPLPEDGTLRTEIVRMLPENLKSAGFNITAETCNTAVSQSKRIPGLVEFLTHEIRCAESR